MDGSCLKAPSRWNRSYRRCASETNHHVKKSPTSHETKTASRKKRPISDTQSSTALLPVGSVDAHMSMHTCDISMHTSDILSCPKSPISHDKKLYEKSPISNKESPTAHVAFGSVDAHVRHLIICKETYFTHKEPYVLQKEPYITPGWWRRRFSRLVLFDGAPSSGGRLVRGGGVQKRPLFRAWAWLT